MFFQYLFTEVITSILLLWSILDKVWNPIIKLDTFHSV